MQMTGFPSPAQGYEQNTFDFNSLLITHPAATFAMRYEGEALESEHIVRGDMLIVDCSLHPLPGKIAVVVDESDFRCVRLLKDESDAKEFCYVDDSGNVRRMVRLFGIVSAVVRML
ncbi:MAG: hypothetical protein LKF96_02715 [Treponema sp.]|jgi:DNA polymerase V|nr:hypothetical protein [Treponema sp.]